MKRKSLVVVKKAKDKISIIKDPKTKKIYKNFKEKLLKIVKKDKFVMAVSGGPDSMSLAYLGKEYSSEFNSKTHILIVDHKLRKESGKEALKVKSILKKNSIQSKILTWRGKFPKSNIQQNARKIRYSLISKYCVKHNIRYLLTAHHMDDQIENFFIRLLRGSGLTGLSSMPDSFNYNNNLKIIRPLLEHKKKDLEHISRKYFQTYIEDPSNYDEKYLRVRVRKYRTIFENEGLDTSKIIKTINNLLSAHKALSFYKNKALHKHASFTSKNKCLINEKIFNDESGEIIFKSFSDILSLVSGTYYPPRSKKIVNLIKRLKKISFQKSTLGGCIIEKKGNFVSISKEQRTARMPAQPKNNHFI